MEAEFILKHNNGTTQYFTHDYLFSLDRESKRNILGPLRRSYRLEELKIFCSCNNPLPQMILNYRSKPTESYYISSRNKDEHSDQCHYRRGDGEYSPSHSIYENGFEEREDGKYEIKFDTQDFQLDDNSKHKNEKSNPLSLSATSIKNSSSGVSTNKPTIYATMLKLLTESWNDIIKQSLYNKSLYPKNDITTLFNRLTNYTAKKYTLKNFSMHDLLYKGEAEGKIHVIVKKHKFMSAAFTMLLLNDNDFQNEGENYRLSLRNPNKDAYRQINVSTAMFNKAMESIRNMPGPYFSGGFVVSTGYQKTPKFISFALVPINDYGAPIESSYERLLYNSLCTQSRMVIKPLKSDDPQWNGYIPDGLLIDTKPSTIIEVFGMSESDKMYHAQRIRKIEHYSSLKSKFDFWYWDAFSQKGIPPLPYK